MSNQKKKKSPQKGSLFAEDGTPPMKDSRNSINIDGNSTWKSLSIIFQSKLSQETECFPDRILMNPSDMRAMGLKQGMLVMVGDALVCRVWISKLQGQDIAILNKIWTPLFEQNVKARKAIVRHIPPE